VSVLSSLLADLQANALEALADAGQPAEHSVIVNGDIAWTIAEAATCSSGTV